MDAYIADIVIFLFFALPAASVIWFLASLIGFFVTRRQREEEPDRFKRWRRSLVASAIVAVVFVAIFVGILVMLVAAVAHM